MHMDSVTRWADPGGGLIVFKFWALNADVKKGFMVFQTKKQFVRLSFEVFNALPTAFQEARR